MRTLLAFAAAAAASATLTYTEEEFKPMGRAHPDARVVVTAALPGRNYDVLDSMLSEISDPKSPLYGQWLTQERVNTLTAPDPAVREEVREWMQSTGGRCIDWPTSLRCSLAVREVEALLDTKLTSFHHVPKDRVIHRIHPEETYTFPQHLQDKLLFITNLRDFPTIRRKLGKGIEAITFAPDTGKVQATDYMIHVESLQLIYNIGTVPTNVNSSAGPAEFQSDTSYNLQDLKQFAAQAGLPEWSTPASHRVGPFTPQDPDAEATLDYQYLNGVTGGGNNIQPWYWTEADWQYEFVEHIKGLPDSGVPKIFSISWGWYEGDQCTVDPGQGPCSGGSGIKQSYAYVAATNAGFLAATSRGISIMVSSGDSGAHGRTDGSCSSPLTRPDWPTACPYITAVGATQISIPTGKPISNPTTPYCKNPTQGQCVGSGTEIVCSTATGALIVSGGGFSNVAPQPTWQSAAVKAYLSSGAKIPPAQYFNASGRGYPDVAMLGHNYLIQLAGSLTAVDGTSCSSPVFAGLVALLNAERMNAGKPVLGFLNPVLYQLAGTAGIFNDVTIGDNTCTEDGCVTGCTGYQATKGWDATTGWGSVNFQNLLAAVKNLP